MTSFALTGGYPTAFATPDYAHTFVMPSCNVTQELICNNTISLVTFYIEATTFINIIGESAEVLPKRFLDPIERDDRCYFEKHRWQPLIKVILSQIFHSQFTPLTEKIFIESKALELMAIILELYSKGNQEQFIISKSDIERIQYAKELLIKDIAQPPSLSKLARMAGTNEYTLKKGFKEIFNMPVFKYLQQVRLAKAYDLFQSTNLQVSEVALLVGYESLSSFTRAFVQTYGMRPSEVRRIPFRTI